MISVILAYIVIMAIFFGGTYALARMIPSALFNWIFVGIVFVGITVPCIAAGPALFGIAVGAASFCGTKYGLKAGSVWKDRR